ncbi:MAG: DUF4143 domain-containing protein, partial [Deltaproteobacteria bacterium]
MLVERALVGVAFDLDELELCVAAQEFGHLLDDRERHRADLRAVGLELDLLAQVLPLRVGSPLSVNNLRQDLSVAFETADRWIGILENLYFCFRIQPYGLPRLRAARKEKKLYMWDWSVCETEAARFENAVASNLLKYCHRLEDGEGDRMELQF